MLAEEDLPPSDDELPRSVSQNVPERSRRGTPAPVSPVVQQVVEEVRSEAKSEGKC